MRRNDLRRNIRSLLFVFIAMFVGLILYLGYSYAQFGERWFATPYNPRIINLKTNVTAGDILDRTGKKLLYTSGDSRKYIKDKGTRIATAHIVGDEYGFSYGTQTMYARYLYGADSGLIEQISELLTGEDRRGSDVTLTIDAELCDTAMDALDGYDGSIVVMNYETGEILASVSSPSFDPTDMSKFKEGGGTSELVNRAISGLYPPGSTFKLIVAAALMENGKDDFTTTCTGSTEIGGQEITCTGVHGEEGLEDALVHSCNVYFAEAAQELGAAVLKAEAEKFLYNRQLNFGSLILGKSMFETGSASDNGWAAVGQYHDLVTPLQACMIVSCIANDGVMMEPQLLYSVSKDGVASRRLTTAVAATPLNDTQALKDMMAEVVKSGTGKSAAVKGYTICGKTGTAQIAIENGETANNAWFVGFVADEGHPLAIAVVMERAGSGGSKAAPAAAKVLKKALSLGY